MERYIPPPRVQQEPLAGQPPTPTKRKAYWKQPINANASSKLSLLSISDHDEERSDQLRSHPPSIIEIPSPPPPSQALTFLEWSGPTTIISVSAYSVKILTVYQGKPLYIPQTKSNSTASLEKPLPYTNKPRPKPILDHIDNKAKREGVSHGNSKPTKLLLKTASISSDVLARETAKELDQMQEDFLQIKQLIKRTEPPPEKIDVKCLPVLYHVNYNLKLMWTMKSSPSMLTNKPGQIFAMLQEELFKKHKCDCVEVEVTDFQEYTDVESNPVIPYAVKKCDIVEVTRILKVRFPETFGLLLPTWSAFDSAMLRPLRFQVNGSLQACDVAMKLGWAIHIGGGFCYNSVRFSKGLAVYDDLLFCLLAISGSPPAHHIDHILVINCDARQSSSYKHIGDIKCKVTILDFYFVKMPESEKTPSQYQNKLVNYKSFRVDAKNAALHLGDAQRTIESVILLSEIKPTLCIYIAGTNVISHPGKPLFQIEHVVHRDLNVFKTVQMEFEIPIAVLLGGGNEETDVRAAAVSITELCKVGWKRLNTNWIAHLTKQIRT